MAAIFRVKRHIEDEPLNAFVLNCKKRKCDTNINGGEQAACGSSSTTTQAFGISQNDETTKTIVKFAGTVETQEETVSHLTKARAIDTTKRIRPPVQNFTTKNRQNHRQQSHESRFQIVNCSRTTDISGCSGQLSNTTVQENASTSTSSNLGSHGVQTEQNVTVVDIEKSIAPNLLTTQATSQTTIMTNTQDINRANNVSSQPSNPVLDQIIEDSSNYVYDLYVADDAESVDFDDDLVQNLLSVQPFDDLVHDQANIDTNNPEFSDNDSEDSNDENNYRNEYPDTEEDDNDEDNLFSQHRSRVRYDDDDNDSINENDMMNAMKSMDLDDELSDDDDESTGNGFMYSVDSESIDFEDDVDYCDVNRYGETYARYKARVIKRNKITKCNSSDDESDCDDDPNNYESNDHDAYANEHNNNDEINHSN